MNLDHARHAKRIGLLMVDPRSFVLELRAHGRGIRICRANGETVRDKGLKARMRSLVIPPAWSGVKVCEDAIGHIQAFGRDARGRKQYRYHPEWVSVRNAVKTERLVAFGTALPALRERVERDLRRRQRDRRATAALAIRLIDHEAMRPGHEKYAADGGLGVASLRKSNLRIVDNVAIIKFVGKSGQEHRIEVSDRTLVKALKRACDGRGRRLLRFRGRTAKEQRLTATILNDYIHEGGVAIISAKDFRTFHGSAEALRFLIEDAPADALSSQAKTKRAVAAAMRSVSARLRNTPAVARSSYVHPAIVTAFSEGALDESLLAGPSRKGLTRPETALMRFLERFDLALASD